MLIYFLRGSLPWQRLEITDRSEEWDAALEKKRSISPEELCLGLPNEFCVFLKYACNLEFEEEPDYCYLSSLFDDLFRREGFVNDSVFDWTEVEKQEVIPFSPSLSSHTHSHSHL